MTATVGSDLETAALRFAAAGWPVFPLHSPGDDGCSCGTDCGSPCKHPRTRNGLRDASTTASVVSRWWGRWPDANIGLRTGAASGLVVLDVDPRHGGDETLFELEQEHGRLPRTLSVVTPSGGAHLFFAYPGRETRNTAGALGPGLDVRADGGYVVAPPSRGINGRRYEPDERCGLAPLPAWLLERLSPSPASARPPAPPTEWLTLLRGISEGGRNQALARLLGHLLRRRVHIDVASELVRLVNAHRCRPPLSADEVDRIIESIASREVRRRGGVR